MRSVTVVFSFLGIFAGIVAPFVRRYGKAGAAVFAGGAAMLVIVAIAGLLHHVVGTGWPRWRRITEGIA